MKNPPIPADEAKRILALENYQILDTVSEQDFDDITALAASICETPVALISFVDRERQWFKSKVGFEATETPRSISFCAHAINGFEVFEIPDATKDERFADNPAVTGGPHVRFYAGAPLTAPDGSNLGTLCVVDSSARKLEPAQIKSLKALSRIVVALLERKKTEAEYLQQTRFLSTVMGELPGLVSYLDVKFNYQFSNAAYEKWFGLKGEQILGKHIGEVLGQKIFEVSRSYMEKALAGQRLSFEVEMPYEVAGQTIKKYVRVNYVPDRNAKGEVCGIFAIVTDLTSQITAEMALASKEARLDMAGGLAHEINTPLGVILGTTENLKILCEMGPVDLASALPYLDSIENTTVRIAKTIEALQLFSSEAGREAVTETGLASIVGDTLALCREKFDKAGIEVRVSVPSAIRIDCRPSQISKIILNLLSNSFDAVESQSKRWVSIDAFAADDSITVTITDSGAPVPAHIAGKMMQPFFSTKEVGKGTGLGLSVAFGIAQAHGGQLSYVADSPETQFRLTLPARQTVIHAA